MKLREWLQEKPFTLTMSSGFFGFFAHLGFLSVLEEEDIIPNKITGSSAGALIGGFFASGLSTRDMKEILMNLKKESFWDPIGVGGFLKGQKFKDLLDDKLIIKNIENTKFDLKVSTFNLMKGKTEVLESGNLAQAIYASCAVPFMFQPILINKSLYVDGGVMDRPGIMGAHKGERVFYHHLISSSRWRKKIGNTTKIPVRDNMITLTIKDLPKVRPNKLKTGIAAYEKARLSMKIALEMKIKDIITL